MPGATGKFQQPGIELRSQQCAGRSRERTAPGASRGRAVFAAPDARPLTSGAPTKLATIATQSHSWSRTDNASRCHSSSGSNVPLPEHLQVNAPIEQAGEASPCRRLSAASGCYRRRSSLGSLFAGWDRRRRRGPSLDDRRRFVGDHWIVNWPCRPRATACD